MIFFLFLLFSLLVLFLFLIACFYEFCSFTFFSSLFVFFFVLILDLVVAFFLYKRLLKDTNKKTQNKLRRSIPYVDVLRYVSILDDDTISPDGFEKAEALAGLLYANKKTIRKARLDIQKKKHLKNKHIKKGDSSR